MADELTKSDLLEIVGGLRDHLDERMDASRVEYGQALRDINGHLATLNGKVAAQEARIAEEAQKTRSLEKEVFDRLRPAAAPTPAPAPVNGDAAPAVTKGDVKRLMAGLAALGVVLELLHQAGTLVLAAARTLLANGGIK